MIIKRPAVSVKRAPEGESLVSVATYVPIKRWVNVLRAFRLSNRVEKQLRQSNGIVTYSLAVNPLRRQFWTYSVWQEPAAAKAFVADQPHATAIKRYQEWAAEGAAFTEWESTSSRLDWNEAFRRLREQASEPR
jgi:hypothetical protein